jgi:hypothetical protein
LATSSWSHYKSGASLSREAPFFVIRVIIVDDFRHRPVSASFARYPPCEFFIRSFCYSRHFRSAAPPKSLDYQIRTGAACGQPIARF